MKKVLIAFDGTQFSEGAFEFARQLNERQPVLLTGLFIPQVSYAYLWSYTSAMTGPAYVPFMEAEDGDVVQRNISRFEDLCVKNSIQYRVHKDFYDFALPELKRETRFADLLIISSEKFYENLQGLNPADYMKDALHEAECPVVIVPEKFVFPRHNILAYDGSGSSVFAIKQFAYLFPELCKNNTVLVFSKVDHNLHLPYEELITELASQHYPNLNITKLDADPKKNFSGWLSDEENAILVSGAYGRSMLSQLFRKSFAEEIITGNKLPVFIAHK